MMMLLLLLLMLLGLATWRFESPTPMKGTKVADFSEMCRAQRRGARI